MCRGKDGMAGLPTARFQSRANVQVGLRLFGVVELIFAVKQIKAMIDAVDG
jgi:hypothetical protein